MIGFAPFLVRYSIHFFLLNRAHGRSGAGTYLKSLIVLKIGLDVG